MLGSAPMRVGMSTGGPRGADEDLRQAGVAAYRQGPS